MNASKVAPKRCLALCVSSLYNLRYLFTINCVGGVVTVSCFTSEWEKAFSFHSSYYRAFTLGRTLTAWSENRSSALSFSVTETYKMYFGLSSVILVDIHWIFSQIVSRLFLTRVIMFRFLHRKLKII